MNLLSCVAGRKLAGVLFSSVLLSVAPSVRAQEAQDARLLRQPAISRTHVAFVYANDIWIAGRDGGEARRLTTFQGAETEPHFSPDGATIAFTGEYDGNPDVYVVPVEGGEPRRLTWHPGADQVRGWTHDGGRVVFASGRTGAPTGLPRFWTIGLAEGMPEPLPLPRAFEGKHSPDGRRLAYQMVAPWESEFRNYRGGQAQPIRIVDLETLAVEKLPWEGSNDVTPVWVGDTVFFLSDRDYASNVWAYDVRTKALAQRTFFKEFDCKNLEAGAGTLIFENGGYLYMMAAAGGEPSRLSITLRGDFPWARPHWEEVAPLIHDRAVSPTGKRALFAARGDILTVPVEKGDVRNLTSSPGSAERAPAWSPDGTHVSWFSDEGGEYQLVVADQYGNGRRTIRLESPTFYYTPVWSPDSKQISFGDADRNLWVVDVASGRATRIDDEGFAHPERILAPVWSPDSKWIAYTKRLPNQFSAIFVYSLDQKKTYQLTDGLSDSRSPAWDASGKYLYFLASTDFALNVGWLDMSSYQRPVHRAVYLAVLPADAPSPLLPESDEEPAPAPAKADEKPGQKADSQKVEVRIDLAGIGQRILALGVPPGDYANLSAGEAGTVFYTENVPNTPGFVLHRYTLEGRKVDDVMRGVTDYVLSSDRKKLLYAAQGAEGTQWGLVDAAGTPSVGDGKLNTGELRAYVDPAAEWRQLFREAWRFQRDFFYVENVHGLDLDWAWRTYSPWLDHVRHRSDLNYLLDILGGETSIGHSFVFGGDQPDVESVPVGLLGADLEVADGRYRIRRIYTAENWNPDLRAPLSGPGIDVREGDYLLAVNGVELTAGMNPYRLFDRTADRQTRLTVGRRPALQGAREVTVVPVASEFGLRSRAWVEDNRRTVDSLSAGRLAYVWVPNTAEAGYTYFNRYYFAQQDKKGAVIDERYNQGGSIADYIVDLLARELLGYFNNPLGQRQPWTAPNAAIWGPKVMVINEMAGSGGDMLPYMFRLRGVGPLVGTRTWGGLVGIWDVPGLVDGGFMTAPRGGFYNLQGEWAVENEGIAPDVEVEEDVRLFNQGRDAQLEKAVEVALELLKTQEVKLLPQPADPVRVRRPQQ